MRGPPCAQIALAKMKSRVWLEVRISAVRPRLFMACNNPLARTREAGGIGVQLPASDWVGRSPTPL